MQLRHIAAVVALVGAGVIAVTPPHAPVVHVADIQLTAGDAEDIVIDIVRHGQRMPPFNEVVTPSPDYPGPPLSDLGQQQALDVANQLHNELGDQVAGIFSGQAIRDMDTAAPFAGLENMANEVQILPGLNEIDSGLYAGDPLSSPGGFLYEVTPLLWTLFGLVSVPIPGSVEDPNGVVMNENFTDAVNAMYNAAMANPVVSDNGQITDVAFNNEADVAAWVTLNVKNPDIAYLLPLTIQTILGENDGYPLLPNTGIIQIEGSPTDGWTLVSWNGDPIPADPGLLTKLLMDLRELIIAPQTAGWNIYEALLGGDPTTIEDALATGLHDVGGALVQFPESVFNDIFDALQNLGTEAGGQAAGGTATALSDIVASLF
ncbi:MAG: histidine phosphatase family protein [Mycobacterium sp.]|uniref:histidine phosphatase family protein n=1 Tax=Mycobacterium sp. TaxID=1785 RepID=UPI003C38F6BB